MPVAVGAPARAFAPAAQRESAPVGAVAEADVQRLEISEQPVPDSPGTVGAAFEFLVAEDDGVAVGAGPDVEQQAARAMGDRALHREERVLDIVVTEVADPARRAVGRIQAVDRLDDAAMGDEGEAAFRRGGDPGRVDQREADGRRRHQRQRDRPRPHPASRRRASWLSRSICAIRAPVPSNTRSSRMKEISSTAIFWP